jgi:hypothetical protein
MMTMPNPRRSAWLPALLLLLASALGTAWLGFRPPTAVGTPVAAIFPPWWDDVHVFTAAASTGGAIVREGAWSNILVVISDEGDLPHRLHAAGAWLVVNPIALDACFKERS